MIIYRFIHYHAGTEDTYGDSCMLGYYKDITTIKHVKGEYCKLPGFSQFPNGFCIFETMIVEAEKLLNDIVYEAAVEIHDENYDFDSVSYLGVFACKERAEEKVKKFQQQNIDLFNDVNLEIECTVSKVKLNDMQWKEGFDYG